MIPTQPKMELSANRPDISSEVVYEVPDTTDDEDIHICGVCKNQFSDIFTFIRHKSEDGCISSRGKTDVSVSISHASSVPVNTHQFQSLSVVGTEICSTVLPKTKYHQVTVESRKNYGDSKPAPQLPLSQPPHLVLAELARRQQATDDCGCVVNDFEDENNHDNGSDSIIDHQPEWNSPWERAASRLSTIYSPPSPPRNPDSELIIQEVDHEQKCQLERGQLIHLPETRTFRASLHRNDFLDVEEDVATLLANHLTNEPQQRNEHSSPCGASNDNSSLLLIFKGEDNAKNFEISSDEIANQDVSSRNASCPVQEAPALVRNAKKRRYQGSLSPAPVAKKFAQSSPKSSLSSTKAIPVKSFSQKKNPHKPEFNVQPPPKKPFSCSVNGCDFSGQSSRDLHRHMCMHTGERPFTCDQCGKGFSRADKLTTHIRIHTGAKSFKCELCSYSCVEHSGLVRHMRVHTDERPYKCQICDYSARVISHLKVHLRTHTGVHPYRCSYQCGKAFKTSSDLRRHERSHSGVKPHACSLCSYKATTKSNLQIHLRQTHSSNETYPCRQCPEICHSKRDQRLHERTHAEHLVPCNKCDFVCLTTYALKEHLKSHSFEKPFVCKFCSFSSNRRGNYRAHMRRQHAYLQTQKSSQKVDVQKKSQDIVRAHDEVDNHNQHECPCCDATFRHAVLLANHMQKHEDGPDNPDDPAPVHCSLAPQDSVEQEHNDDPDDSEPFLPPLTAPQDPVLADSADSRDSTDNTTMDNSESYTSLVNLANCSEQMQPVYLYRHISSELSDNIRGAEILASLNQGGGTMPQYVTIQPDQPDQNAFVETLGGIQYVLCGPLDDNDNATNLLC